MSDKSLFQIKVIVIAFGALVLIVFALKQSDTISFVGRIDDSLTKILENSDDTFTLEIDSGGGYAIDAAQSAEIIISKDIEVLVRGRCLSACSEFILPAAQTITFETNPIIGFHWSPIMDRMQFNRYATPNQKCEFLAAEAQDNILRATNLNENFWKEVESKLILNHYSLHDNGSQCPDKLRTFVNRTWLPTSKQLKSVWGLDFSGSVCADDLNKCILVVNDIWEPGDRIVIGDVVHTVSKPDK